MPELSPIAQQVLRAATDVYDEWDLRDSIAEALRTAAVYCTYDRIRLLAIADQLDTRGNP